MRTFSVSVVFLAVLIVQTIGADNKELEDVEKFIQQEIDKDHVPVKRSSMQTEVTGKPDKISVTISKEYKVQTPDGKTEFISIPDTDGGLKSRMSPVVNEKELNKQEINTATPKSTVDYKILKATDLTFAYESVRPTQHQPVSIASFPVQQAPRSFVPVPRSYKRKSMDGWMPMFGSYIGPHQRGLAQQYKDFYAKNQFSKGAYYSPYKDALHAESSNVPQVATDNTGIKIQKAIPQLNFFTQGEVVEGEAGSNIRTPSVSQIQAYGATPQISALLRERFRGINNQQGVFPKGGLALRSLAQAVRNGAFSLENDVIPSSEKPQEVEIAIPHRFKMRKPQVFGGYSTVNMQGNTQATAASITDSTQLAYGVPGKQPGAAYGGVQPALRDDYGDGVKYALKGPIQIMQTLPDPGYGVPAGGNSLNELAADLEQRLRQLVQQEVLMQTMLQQQQHHHHQQQSQYGVPEVVAPIQQHPFSNYGVAPPLPPPHTQQEYGVPGEQPGAPLDSYGPGNDDVHPVPEYGPPIDDDQHHHHHHVEHHPEKPKKPFTLNLGFDTGFWGDPHAHIEVDGGDEVPEHHDHIHEHEHIEHDHHHEGPTLKDEVKERLVILGQNLFHSALEFSRHYNPITFLEKVKEFPPIRFEVYDVPKKGKGHKKGKRHGRRHKKGRGKRHRH
ncbi:uncharacterized protein LOC110844839 [Folsomia candida]|uniref:uncharacterized protein LOC110844839 n=1 Tax=Folsomia candida TaxID=158441 RepID=UPI000B907ADC|nr:uncharacterized protein LOC110844839 [Folsomia candida]